MSGITQTCDMDARSEGTNRFKVSLDELEASARVSPENLSEGQANPHPETQDDGWRRQQETLRYASG